MSKLLALACAAVGAVILSATSARAAQPVNALPAVAHINQTVVVETGHRRHHDYYRHHHRRGYYYRHHRRYYY